LKCAWNDLLGILPAWLRPEVDSQGKDILQELRLRINAPPELVLGRESCILPRQCSAGDLRFVVNAASNYSPWAAQSVSRGYLCGPGGHRIGLCGVVACKDGVVTGIREPESLCIRVARDHTGIGNRVLTARGNVLILGAPGTGKTTMLRDMTRQIAQRECICVVDERGELFPQGFQRGRRMDVLTGAPKAYGLETLVRTMSPRWIAVDEITAPEDCTAMLAAVGCGVRLIATAHAGSLAEFHSRSIYTPLIQHRVFQTVYRMGPDKTCTEERINGCGINGLVPA